MENAFAESEDEIELAESGTDSSSSLPPQQRPRSKSRTHRHQHSADFTITSVQQRGRATEKTMLHPTLAPHGGGDGFNGVCRARPRLRMTESQILEKLGTIVSDGHPSEKYATLERIGHG